MNLFINWLSTSSIDFYYSVKIIYGQIHDFIPDKKDSIVANNNSILPISSDKRIKDPQQEILKFDSFLEGVISK